MAPALWLKVLAGAVEMAPGFLAALDQQLRGHARTLTGVDIGSDYTLLPPDDGFSVQFHTAETAVIGAIEGFLVDPSAFGHPVALGWRARGAAEQPIAPDQEHADLEFFWLQFPIAELAAGRHAVATAAPTAVNARFPVEWDVHPWQDVFLLLRAHRRFTLGALDALNAALRRAVRDWSARRPHEIDYLGEPQIAPDRSAVRWHLDLNVPDAGPVVAVINALDATPTATQIAQCVAGRRSNW